MDKCRGAFDLSKGAKGVLRFLMLYMAFLVFILVNKIAATISTPFIFMHL
jgi:FHS family L-fucose permease-like MFS transporter